MNDIFKQEKKATGFHSTDLEACIKLAWITSVPGNRNYWLLLSVLTAVHTRQPAATLTAPAAFHKNM